MLQKSPNRLFEIEICNDRIGDAGYFESLLRLRVRSMLRDKMLKIGPVISRHRDGQSAIDH